MTVFWLDLASVYYAKSVLENHFSKKLLYISELVLFHEILKTSRQKRTCQYERSSPIQKHPIVK